MDNLIPKFHPFGVPSNYSSWIFKWNWHSIRVQVVRKNSQIYIREITTTPTWLLWKMTFRHEATLKLRKIALIANIHLKFAWQKKMVSSVNCNSFTSTSLFPTFTPSKTPDLKAYLTNLANLSAIIKNRNGARESPCLIPLVGLNSLMGLLLINIDAVEDLRQLLI